MKKLFIFLCCVALMHALLLPISADSVDTGSINSSALNYFEGVVNKLPSNCHYVIYKTGDYTSSLLYGFDLELNGSNIVSSSECTELIYNQRVSSNSGYYPSFSTVVHDSYFLSTSETSMIYSSLGNWPSVGDSNKNNVEYILWTVVLIVLLFIVFKFHRNRRHYINL